MTTHAARSILLATRSADKVREIRDLLRTAPGVSLLSLRDAGIAPDPGEDDIECHPSFRQNALAKARHFAGLTGMTTLADDSGLCVHALGGMPGVHSRRFAAGSFRNADQDDANNRELLRRLLAVPDPQRTAHYLCAAALVRPGADTGTITAIGTCSGRITAQPIGDNGFGYDPLFLLPDLGLTFAQIPLQEKQRRSHRARAFRAMLAIAGSLTP
jgi:XTP/dITP diphosphohydrolase